MHPRQVLQWLRVRDANVIWAILFGGALLLLATAHARLFGYVCRHLYQKLNVKR